MRKVFIITTVFFLAMTGVLFFSCASSGHLPVPGEKAEVNRGISVEYMSIATAYEELEKYDKAIEYYKLAMKNKKLYWSAYYKLGRCYAMAKDYTQARKIYFKLLKRDKDNLSLQLSLAYLYAMEGKLDKARVIYEFLWKENQSNADVLVNYIDILIAQKEYETAETMLNTLKETFSDNTNIKTFEDKLNELNPKPVELSDEEKDNVIEEDVEVESGKNATSTETTKS